MIAGHTAAATAVVMVEAGAVAVVAAVETIETTTTATRRGVAWRECREETSVIRTAEVAVFKTNALHATWSTPHLKTESYRGARGSSGQYRKAINYNVQCDAIRRSRFRNVRRVPPNELRVFNWMKIFAVREFFEDEIRDRLSQHDARKLRTQAQLRLLRLKLDLREWFRVRNRDKIEDA
jgi:hypothetical protein